MSDQPNKKKKEPQIILSGFQTDREGMWYVHAELNRDPYWHDQIHHRDSIQLYIQYRHHTLQNFIVNKTILFPKISLIKYAEMIMPFPSLLCHPNHNKLKKRKENTEQYAINLIYTKKCLYVCEAEDIPWDRQQSWPRLIQWLLNSINCI